METLVIVDFQKDFSKPNGSLYVTGAEQAKASIIDYIQKNKQSIAQVIFTIDWHGLNHCSFKRNGGEWPDHCIQFTEGAGIDDDIFRTCIELNIPNIKIFKKGNVNSLEEYGAFERMDHIFIGGKDRIICSNLATNSIVEFDCFTLTVCGIAGDYCVKNTINNIITGNCPVELNVQILKSGIASIDDGTSIDNFIKENNLKVVE